jgi:hypothetical protein
VEGVHLLIEVPSDDIGDGLAQLVTRHGTELAEQPTRLRDLLHTKAGAREPEISLLVDVAEVGIAGEFARARGVASHSFDELAVRLRWERGVAPEDARWAIETWAWALGVEEPSPVESPEVGRPAALDRVHRFVRSHPVPFSISGVAIAVLVAALIAGLVIWRSAPGVQPVAARPARSPGPTSLVISVSVPEVVGASRTKAKARLERAGLRWITLFRETQEAQAGTVLRQHPRPGASLDQGSIVTLWIATSPEPVGSPRHLRVDKSTTSVILTWDPSKHGTRVDHYEIWRDGEKIGERSANRRTFTDGGLTPGSTHLYGIIAIGENGTHATSHSRTVKVPAPAPSPSPSPSPATGQASPPPPPSSPSPSPCTAPDPTFCD